MSANDWWAAEILEEPPRWRLFRRRTTRARPALRLEVLRALPTDVVNLSRPHIDPTAVEWLLRGKDFVVREVSSVDVTERPDRIAAVGVPERSEKRTSTGLPRSDERVPQSEEPSLADRLRALLAVPLDALLPGPEATIDWAGTFLPFQLDGVRALVERDRLLLADDMGLGKTVQAAAAIRILCLQRRIQRVLLVIPASLREQWRRELRLWAPELRIITVQGSPKDRAWQWTADAHVTIVSYETLRADFTDNPQSAPRRRVWDLVVLDEAQKIKNPSVEVSRECKLLERRRSWAMTGTPIENRIEDLASILEFVDRVSGEEPVRYGSREEMLRRHRELQLRRRKMDVLDDLPPKHVINLAIPLLEEQQQTYDRAEQEGVLQLKERGAEIRIQHVLELILRLKQVCNFCPRTGESAKLADIRTRMEVLTAEGHKALIFSQFTDATFGVERVAHALAEFRPLSYTGGMSGQMRDRVVQEFKGSEDHRALVLSLRAGGVGLNLQEASYVFHLDRWWNPAVERQAEDRVYRMGQVFPVTVFKYTAIGTIEERIEQIISDKQQLFDEVIDDVSMDLGTRLTSDELFGLFDLSPPTAQRRHERASQPPGLDLERRCADLLRQLGWSVQETPRSRDGGVDLIADRIDEVGIEHRLFVQCKDYARPVGVEVVRELLGVIPPGQSVRAVLAAPSGLTADADHLARQRGVILWDEEAIGNLESS